MKLGFFFSDYKKTAELAHYTLHKIVRTAKQFVGYPFMSGPLILVLLIEKFDKAHDWTNNLSNFVGVWYAVNTNHNKQVTSRLLLTEIYLRDK